MKTTTNKQSKTNKQKLIKPLSIQLPEVIYLIIQTIENYKSKQLFNLVKFSLGFMFKANTMSQDFEIIYQSGVNLKEQLLCTSYAI